MQLITILALTVGIASAADICRTTGGNCGGNKVCCSGIQEGNCCNLGTARSQLLWNLPDNSRGQAWTGTGCNSGSTGSFKNPTKVTGRCVTFSWAVISAKWLAGGGTKRDVDDVPCSEPNMATYELDGVEHKVQIPEGQGETVGAWIDGGDWDKLSALADYE